MSQSGADLFDPEPAAQPVLLPHGCSDKLAGRGDREPIYESYGGGDGQGSAGASMQSISALSASSPITIGGNRTCYRSRHHLLYAALSLHAMPEPQATVARPRHGKIGEWHGCECRQPARSPPGRPPVR